MLVEIYDKCITSPESRHSSSFHTPITEGNKHYYQLECYSKYEKGYLIDWNVFTIGWSG